MSQAANSPLAASQVSAGAPSPVGKYLAIGGGLLLLLGLYYLWSSAQRVETLPTVYGKRRGAAAADSINGAGVLANMFSEAGHKVRSISRLSPRVEEFQTIVWFPDNFEPPTAEQRDYLENWLSEGYGRTLIYVGRDFDAAEKYWRDIEADAPPEKLDEIKRRLAAARSSHDSQRAAIPEEEFARWFTLRRGDKPARVKSLSGPWAEGVDASKVEIEVEGQLAKPDEKDRPTGNTETIPEQVETLLDSENGPLATRFWPDDSESQIIVLTNGSFVLNYPLVNHEHRKLAARLVNEVSEGNVAFLESDEDGPKILDKEPASSAPTGLQLIKVWPLNVLLFHLTMLGIIYCLARWTIFGRPKELPPDSPTDFGKHVTAFGQLLSKTRDTAYAQSRLQQYRQQSRRDSGKAHR